MWLLPVAAETWDGYLNDINGHHVTEDTVVAALNATRSGPVEEGSVGGGTGMNCYQFKGGSGTASRLVPFAAVVQATEEAVVQATEEAVVNALVANQDMTGRDGHRTPALPREKVVGLLSAASRLTR